MNRNFTSSPRAQRLAGLGGGLLMVLALGFLNGCAGYRLGTTLPPHIRTVHVPLAENQTREPDLESAVTRAVLQAFQQDGTLRLQDAGTADTTLLLTIQLFRWEPVIYGREDRATADEYRLRIGVEARFIDHRDGSVRLDAALLGEATFPATTADVTSALREAIEPAAQDLAREVVNAVISAW